MTPADSIWFICGDVKPYSCRTSAVCSPVTGSEVRQGSAGVRDRTGAGRGLSSPLESFMKEPLSRLCGCELTWSKDNTGVTQASVPSKISDHSAWLFEAKRSVKIRLSSGQSSKLIWEGNSPASNSKPRKKKKKNFLWPKSNIKLNKLQYNKLVQKQQHFHLSMGCWSCWRSKLATWCNHFIHSLLLY